MTNQMPTMPTEPEQSLPGEVAPSEIEPEKPIIEKPEENVSSEVKIPLTAKTGIKVIATRKGFYGQMRIKLGQEFVVKKFSQLGEWMKCEDPAMERERVKFFKDKKAKK